MSRSRAWPTAVRLVDIERPLTAIDGMARYSRARVYIKQGDRLLGYAEISHDGAETISASRLRDALAAPVSQALFKNNVEQQLRARATDDASRPPVLEPTAVSIIVPACDRPEDLRRCLSSLVAQKTRHALEIVVVDNRPSVGSVSAVAREFPSVRLITEARPGLSYARNAGIAAATGAIIVATDDDVTAPVDWIDKLVAPFARQDVMCVTGNVLPLELETEAQCRFEAYGGLGKGFSRLEVDGRWFRTRRAAVPTWILGATANAAFRASCFSNPAIGLLDEALGAGTPTGCSEDTDLFYRILKNDGTLVYEPSAYVWHRHRTSMEALRRQIYAYSKGHVAYHLTTLLRDRDRRAVIRLLYSLPTVYAHRVWHRLRGWSEYPISLILLEVAGTVAGPGALWRSRRRVRRLRRTELSHAVPVESPISQDPAA